MTSTIYNLSIKALSVNLEEDVIFILEIPSPCRVITKERHLEKECREPD